MRRHSFQGPFYLAHSIWPIHSARHYNMLNAYTCNKARITIFTNIEIIWKFLSCCRISTVTKTGSYLEPTNHKLSTAATAATSCYHFGVYVHFFPPPLWLSIPRCLPYRAAIEIISCTTSEAGWLALANTRQWMPSIGLRRSWHWCVCASFISPAVAR
jgi:hypothetical protein